MGSYVHTHSNKSSFFALCLFSISVIVRSSLGSLDRAEGRNRCNLKSPAPSRGKQCWHVTLSGSFMGGSDLVASETDLVTFYLERAEPFVKVGCR